MLLFLFTKLFIKILFTGVLLVCMGKLGILDYLASCSVDSKQSFFFWQAISSSLPNTTEAIGDAEKSCLNKHLSKWNIVCTLYEAKQCNKPIT